VASAPARRTAWPAPVSCGTAGTAHVCHRLFRATGVPLFEEAAVLWLRHTLALRQPGVGS
jgi:hypothetical protein